MCFGGGGEGVSSQDQVTQQAQAQAMTMLNNDHKKRYKKGVEKGLMDYLKDDSTIGAAADAGAANAMRQMGIASAMQDNAMARTGMPLTPEQRAAMKSKQDLAGATLVTGEANRARAGEAQLKDTVRDGMMNLGRNSMQQGMGLYSSAANIEQQRGHANAIAKEQERQQTGQAIATVASLAMMSDKKKKTDISKMDTKDALAEVRGMDLKNWRYKDGVGPDTDMHRGPMAQDAPDSITNREKTMINVHDELQLGMGAIQELAAKVDRMERRIGA